VEISNYIQRPMPEVVFHYTSSQGLLGIADSGSLWATNIHYLNDSKELNHAFDVFRNELLGRKDKNPLHGLLINSFDNIRHMKLFVCSFTEEGDLLSQWRGYCPEGAGISLGFEFSKIKDSALKQGYTIGPCIYEESEKRRITRIVIDDLMPVLSSMVGKYPENHIRGYFYERIVKIVPFMKHSSFKEEKEWRCSLSPSADSSKQIKYRVGRSIITPYHEFDLKSNGRFSIKGVIIGPCEQKRLQINSVMDVLSARGIEWGQSSYSSTPYRAW